MKKILPFICLMAIGCSTMLTNDIPPAPTLAEANLDCILRCQEIHATCVGGNKGIGGISKSRHYNICSDQLESCYGLCRQAH